MAQLPCIGSSWPRKLIATFWELRHLLSLRCNWKGDVSWKFGKPFPFKCEMGEVRWLQAINSYSSCQLPKFGPNHPTIGTCSNKYPATHWCWIWGLHAWGGCPTPWRVPCETEQEKRCPYNLRLQHFSKTFQSSHWIISNSKNGCTQKNIWKTNSQIVSSPPKKNIF